jgi:UDP-N-acetylmuramoylalanine--D-glutamate ligase
MRDKEYFKNKKVTIVGFARSGLACANLLYTLGADVSVTDNRCDEATRGNLKQLKSQNLKVELGTHTQEFINGRGLVVVSPGVPNNSLPCLWAKQQGIPIIGEIELAWSLCPSTVIAVTGSNGKTTVTTLIASMLQAKGLKAVACGNIGKPFSQEVENMGPADYVALEVSSFQLERIEKFKPYIAVILNFTANHLDRHKDIQEYLEAKKRIFMNQDSSDYLVLNNNDPVLREVAREAKSRVVFFSETKELNPNYAAILAVGSILGIEKGLVVDLLSKFKGIEHRLERVREINGIEFINDSKSTTADSTLWALKTVGNPVILIAGGRDKGVDYKRILSAGKDKIKKVILIGEAKGLIRGALKDYLAVEDAVSLEEAVIKAYNLAGPGDCVLLSPMCSSFDMFLNYEDRGERFKRAVFDLAAKEQLNAA